MAGAPHIPTEVQAEMESKYKVGDLVEALDWDRMSRLKVATVKLVVGKRLHVEYFDAKPGDTGLWCHEDSERIHPCGWAATIGHEIVTPGNYSPEILPPSYFQFTRPYPHLDWKEGWKLEFLNPYDLTVISVGTIQKVLNYGYIMVRADSVENTTPGTDWICLHVTSEDIFPCGFAEKHKIKLALPVGYDESTFEWNDYILRTRSFPAPGIGYLIGSILEHDWKYGMKVEAADLWEPSVISVATIIQSAGNLVKIHFDGWDKKFDQWMSANSPDLYHKGYCKQFGHTLAKPPVPAKTRRKP